MNPEFLTEQNSPWGVLNPNMTVVVVSYNQISEAEISFSAKHSFFEVRVVKIAFLGLVVSS